MHLPYFGRSLDTKKCLRSGHKSDEVIKISAVFNVIHDTAEVTVAETIFARSSEKLFIDRKKNTEAIFETHTSLPGCPFRSIKAACRISLAKY